MTALNHGALIFARGLNARAAETANRRELQEVRCPHCNAAADVIDRWHDRWVRVWSCCGGDYQ